VRTFVDAGAPMGGLLRQAIARGVSADYGSKLLAALVQDARQQGRGLLATLGTGVGNGVLVEPLSERELQVLRLLAAGLTNQAIADQLYLAVGTVKKYTSNIYGKLGVGSRTQAAARARELGLL
jgi:LuxR family maltose regulon positive regulatory protein